MVLLSKLICLAFCAIILLQAYGVRRVVGTWIYPACLYGLFWFAFTIVPVALVPETYSSPYAVAYILASCCAVSLGGITIDFARSYRQSESFERQDRQIFGSTLMYSTLVGCVTVAMICSVVDAAIQGISLGALISDFFETSNSYLVSRYTDNLVANVFSQISTILNYLASFVGGLLYWAVGDRAGRWKKAAIILLTFIPSVFVLLVQAAKGTIFLSLALFVAGILVCRVRAKQNLPLNWRTFVIVVRYTLLLVPLLVLSFISRGLYQVASTDDVLFNLRRYFASYALGHMYAFSDWFDYWIGVGGTQYYRHIEASHGFFTFMPIFRIFGDDRFVPAGVYDEYYTDGNLISTNIYTAFRGMITDFSLAGSLGITICISLIVHMTFKRMATRYESAFSISMFVIFCCYLSSSYIISVLIWNSVYLLFFVIALFLIIVRLSQRLQNDLRHR